MMSAYVAGALKALLLVLVQVSACVGLAGDYEWKGPGKGELALQPVVPIKKDVDGTVMNCFTSRKTLFGEADPKNPWDAEKSPTKTFSPQAKSWLTHARDHAMGETDFCRDWGRWMVQIWLKVKHKEPSRAEPDGDASSAMEECITFFGTVCFPECRKLAALPERLYYMTDEPRSLTPESPKLSNWRHKLDAEMWADDHWISLCTGCLRLNECTAEPPMLADASTKSTHLRPLKIDRYYFRLPRNLQPTREDMQHTTPEVGGMEPVQN